MLQKYTRQPFETEKLPMSDMRVLPALPQCGSARDLSEVQGRGGPALVALQFTSYMPAFHKRRTMRMPCDEYVLWKVVRGTGVFCRACKPVQAANLPLMTHLGNATMSFLKAVSNPRHVSF